MILTENGTKEVRSQTNRGSEAKEEKEWIKQDILVTLNYGSEVS